MKFVPKVVIIFDWKYLKSKFEVRNTFFDNNVTNPVYVSSRYKTPRSIG